MRLCWVVIAVVACAACGDGAKGGAGVDQGVDQDAADLAVALDMAEDLAAPDLGPQPRPYPAPDGHEASRGPGGPTRTFSEDELLKGCAYLDGGEKDKDFHNLVVMYDGYLLMPWASEASAGGLSFFDVSDPCAPKLAGTGTSAKMRETHAIGFSSMGGRWAVVNGLQRYNKGGVQFWDISDPSAPTVVSDMEVPGFLYPDAYKRVVLSVFWQAPYVYATGSQNGVYVIDASDPRAPVLVNQVQLDPVMQTGALHAVGDLLVVTSSQESRTVLFDISDPADPQPIPGGDFELKDMQGVVQKAYFSTVSGGYIYYALKSGGGGLLVVDIHDPTRPVTVGERRSEGNGGYVFIKEQLAFVGETNFATLYDLSDLADIKDVGRLTLQGDQDTLVPIGNIAVLSVDDKAERDKATMLAPYATAVDTTPPEVTWSFPGDGATITPSSRIGVTLSEMIDVQSAWEGSVRLYEEGVDPGLGRVDGHISVQEHIINFWPASPLERGKRYVFELPAGGVRDYNGNRLAVPFKLTVQVAP
jgi:hypothetical protein